MDLAAYIKERGLLPESKITQVTNNYLVHKYTMFQELYLNGSDYGVDINTLFSWLLDVGGPGYEVLTGTKGYTVYHVNFDKLGGVSNCIKMCVMCLSRRDDPIRIVTQRPDDPGLTIRLNKAFGQGKYTFAVCTRDLWDAFHRTYIDGLVIEAQAVRLSDTLDSTGSQRDAIKDSESRKLYMQIIDYGISHDASDIHIQPRANICEVHYRVDGQYCESMRIPLGTSDRLANLLLIDGKIAATNPDKTVDGKIVYFPQGKEGDPSASRDLRFSILPAIFGRDVNIRFLNNRLFTFEELGMSEDNINAYKQILNMPQGLIIQVGPTGSGKSTTQYAGLKYIRENSLRNIITAEDPVEIVMEGITQVSTKDEAGLTFAQISRQFLRHDVDIGVIGEIRDDETAFEAVRAATTGHLILSSLHTNDSLGAVERLIRLGVEPYTLSEVLVAIMGQRLVRRLCPHCKKPVELDFFDPRVRAFGFPEQEGKHTFYESEGCEHCNNLGYKGRIAVNEILVVDRELRDMIQRHETRKVMETHLTKINWKSMYSDALDKALSGVTSLQELSAMSADTLAFK